MRFLRKRMKSKQAIKKAPRKIPGTKPAANDAPENMDNESEPAPAPYGSVTLAAVGIGVLVLEPVTVAAVVGGVDVLVVAVEGALCAKHEPPWHR